jgi:PAS domain S-box-containing protein
LAIDCLMKNIAISKISIGFAVTLVVLVVNSIVAYHSINAATKNNRAEIRSDEVLDILRQMLMTLKNVELGQREYFLTNNNPQYLAARKIDIDRLRKRVDRLVAIESELETTIDPGVSRFAKTIDRQLDNLVATIDKRQAQVLTPDTQVELSNSGQRSIALIQQIIGSLETVERQKLARLQTASHKNLVEMRVAFGISGLLDLLLLGGLYGLVSWDLTKRQQAESRVKDYAIELEQLYQNAPCGYHALDPAGKFLRINRTELQMLGYEEAEIIGCKSFEDLLAPDSRQRGRDNLAIVSRQGWVRDVELQMVCKDGRIVPVSTDLVAMYDEFDNYLGCRSTLIDISDRIYLRQQARLSNEISQKIRQSLQLTEILQTIVDEIQQLLGVDRVLIFQFEPDGSGTVIRERVLADYPAVMGSQILDPCFVGAASQNENRSYHARFAQGRIYTVADISQAGLTPCYIEFLQKFAVKATAIVPIHQGDNLWGLLIVHHCQSPRQWQPSEVEILSQLSIQIGIALAQAQLLAQAQSQSQELSRSNAELEQFAHVTSHDLQEPLRTIVSYLQLLERRYQGKLDRDADEFINYAVDGATRMQALIQALLGYARIGSRKQPFESVDCQSPIGDAISNLYVAITESGAEVTADPLPKVWGDATQLTQLFQNLIANGIKFRCDEVTPRIHISSTPIYAPISSSQRIDLHPSPTTEIQTVTAWQFAVRDNGIGIEPRYLDRIFVIFQRLHTRVAYPGTGIGLAICKKIVERHGGTIWVESTPARSNSSLSPESPITLGASGSTFYFRIPAVNPIADRSTYPQSPL